jgi:hypothetical protein
MEMLALLIAVSTTMWFAIDRLKILWTDLSFGKWITVAVSAVGSFFLTFSFGLDIIFAWGFTPAATTAGEILTAFVIMSGSSAVAEIIERVKGKKTE